MNEVAIYIHGASGSAEGIGSWACIIVDQHQIRHMSGREYTATSARMELTACVHALEALAPPGRPVVVRCANHLIVSCMQKNIPQYWKGRGWLKASRHPVKHPDLWDLLLVLCQKHYVRWERAEESHPWKQACRQAAHSATGPAAFRQPPPVANTSQLSLFG